MKINALMTKYALIHVVMALTLSNVVLANKVTQDTTIGQPSSPQKKGVAISLDDISISSIDFSAVYLDIALRVENNLQHDLTVKSVSYEISVRGALIKGELKQRETFLSGKERPVRVLANLPHSSSSSVVLELLAAKSRSVPYKIKGEAFIEERNEPIKYEHEDVYVIAAN